MSTRAVPPEVSAVIGRLRDAGVPGRFEVERGGAVTLVMDLADTPRLTAAASAVGVQVRGSSRLHASVVAGGVTVLEAQAGFCRPGFALQVVAQLLLDWQDDLAAGRMPERVDREFPGLLRNGLVTLPCSLEDLLAEMGGSVFGGAQVARVARDALVDGPFGVLPNLGEEAQLVPAFLEDVSLHECFLGTEFVAFAGPTGVLLRRLNVLDLARREVRLEREQQRRRAAARDGARMVRARDASGARDLPHP